MIDSLLISLVCIKSIQSQLLMHSNNYVEIIHLISRYYEYFEPVITGWILNYLWVSYPNSTNQWFKWYLFIILHSIFYLNSRLIKNNYSDQFYKSFSDKISINFYKFPMNSITYNMEMKNDKMNILIPLSFEFLFILTVRISCVNVWKKVFLSMYLDLQIGIERDWTIFLA